MAKQKARADGRYAKQIYLGKDANGKRQYKTVYGNSPNGSGLGLSIARSIVRQMGGTLTVTSENQLVTFVAVFYS